MSIDDDITKLYRLPLDEFTPARDKLAKELRSAGDKETAAQVKSLKKPNLAAWALNQLAAHHGRVLEELFEVTANVRDAQRKVMSGRKADLRKATDERNAVVAKLTKLGEALLEEGGHSASGQTMSAIGDSLVGVASDEQGAEALRSGRLTREFKPGSVVDVGVLGVVPDDARDEEPEEDAGIQRAIEAAKRRAEQAAAAADAAEAEARRLADEAEQADRRARSAAEAAEFARRAAEGRRSDADEAAEALKRLEQ